MVRTRPLPDAIRYGLPGSILVAATALALLVLPHLSDPARAHRVAAALTLDFTVVVPALVFVLVVRARRAPWVIIIPTFAVGYVLAAITIPDRHHEMLDMIRALLIPAELGVVAYVLTIGRKLVSTPSREQDDFVTRFRAVARRVLASRILGDVLTTEVSVLYYALRWRRAPRPGRGCHTVYRDVGYLAVLIAVSMILLVEGVAVHLFVSRWNSTVAWVLTGVTAYVWLWLVGDYRAMAARPIRLAATYLAVRVGLRWEVEIPLTTIARVELLRLQEAAPGDALVAAVLHQPNFRIVLNSPIDVTGLYGIRRAAREIWLTVDGAASLCHDLRDIQMV